MAIIPLRQYNRDIESMIDAVQLDEAVAHCRHILELFPKHIDTYRLLGKAHLEQQRYGDATDVFNRVLSSVPDDFVASVGMSIIREDEANMDAAIWFMERASEAMPANNAIKDELRRLYGRRDGVEPPKIRLTRAALARMYSKGGLYDQAISELRAALVEDPGRPDYLVLLAEMHFHLGQQIEAVDTCGILIKKLPYCLVANRILSLILPGTGRADDAKTYHQRCTAMDPYFATAASTALSANAVPENTVTLDRMTYTPGQESAGPAQPAWAASLGVSFDDVKVEQLPDWLQDLSASESDASTERISTSDVLFSWETKDGEAAEEEQQPARTGDQIPDWMREAGWKPGTGKAIEGQESSELDETSEQPEDEIVKAEVPDWLKELSPTDALGQEQPSLEDEGEAEVMPWLQEKIPGPTDSIIKWLGVKKPEDAAAADELAAAEEPAIAEKTAAESMLSIESSEETLAVEPGPPEMTTIDDEILQDLTTALTAEQPREDVETPDWLKDLSEADRPVGETIPVQPAAEEMAATAEGMPDRQLEVGESAPIVAEASVSIEPLPEGPTQTAEVLPDWLKELGETAPPVEDVVPSEPVAEEPAALAEVIPDWFKEIGEAALPGEEIAATEPGAEELAAPAENLPDWLQEVGEAAPSVEEITTAAPVAEEPAAPAESLPDWLQEVGEAAPSVEEITTAAPVAVEPAAPAESLPDWLKEIGEAAPSAEEIVTAEPVAEEPAAEAEGLPDWLKEIGVTAPAVEENVGFEPVAEEPAAPAEDLPDWIKDIGETTPAVKEIAPIESGAEETGVPIKNLPEWLKEVGIAAPAEDELVPVEIAPEPAPPAEELPDWLKEAAGSVPITEESLSAEPSAEVRATPAGDLPEWLKEMAEASSAAEQIVPAEPAAEEHAFSTAELPEWLKEMAKANLAAEEIVQAEAAAEVPIGTTDAMPEWLKEMAEADRAVEEIVPTEMAAETPVEIGSEWVKEEGEVVRGVEYIPSGEPVTPEAAPLEALAGAPVDLTDQDAALAWLEGLAAQHGAKEEELITAPEGRSGIVPDWVKAEAGDALAEIETQLEPVSEEPAVPAEDLPDWLKEIGISTPVVEPFTSLGPLSAEILTPAEPQLDSLSDTAPRSIAPEPESASEQPIEQESELDDELPDWLKETPATAEVPAPEQDTASIEDLPTWMDEVEKALPKEAEMFPTAETPEAPAWMPEAIQPEEPLAVDAELQSEVPEAVQAEPEASLPEEAALVETERAGEMLNTAALFDSARRAVDAGDPVQAADLYDQLVKQGADYELVASEVQTALYRHPVDINLWIVLGDAHLRSEKLQDALDAYTKAEGLLR